MKKIERDMLEAIKAGDVEGASWLMYHRRLLLTKAVIPRLISPYASTMSATAINEHLGVEPAPGDQPRTYLIADFSVPGVVTLTAEGDK